MFSFLLLLLFLGCASAHDLNDTNVSLELDDTLESDGDSGSFSELQDLINANANGELNLTKSYIYDSEKDSNLKNGITINNPITINGNGNILDGNNAARIFSIPEIKINKSVVLNNITFINGNYNYGAAIFLDNMHTKSPLMINDCVFEDNVASSSGGAVYFVGTSLLINNSVFNSNKAYNGGAVYIDLGVDSPHPPYIIENSIFEENIASSGGGAINLNDNDALVRNSTFIKNRAGSDGGAIFCTRERQTLINNKFYENYAGSNGGAVNWALFVMDTKEQDGLSKNNVYISNTAVNYGGSIYVYNLGSYVTKGVVFSNETIEYGHAGSGGAISVWGDDVKIYNSSIKNTFSNYAGGAIYIQTMYANNIYIDNVTFKNTSASTYGGAVASYSGRYLNDGAKIYNSHFYDTRAERSGGAIYFWGKNIDIKNSYFNNTANTGSYNGGAIYLAGDSSLIENCEVSNAYSPVNGGGVVISAVDTTIKNTTFTNCIVGSANSVANRNGGGAVYWYGDNGKLLDSTFINNYGRHAGGGIYVAADNGILINNTTFISNSAYDGGGVYIEGVNSIINNSRFIDNTAKYGGAGANIEGTNGSVLNSNFTGNNAMNYGGALSVIDAKISDCDITGNIASFGGGIYTYNSTIENTQFENNNARELGGDVFGINTASLINSDVDDIFNNKLTELVSDFEWIKKGWGYDTGKYHDFLPHEFGNMWPDDNPYSKFSMVVDNSSKLLRNILNGDDVSDYIKILIVDYGFSENGFGSNTDLGYLIYYFLETDYKNSNNEYVKNVIKDYDSGKRYPDSTPVLLSNNTVAKLNFITLINPNIYSNLFGVYFGVYAENITVKTLNKTTNVGDIVEFEVNITNNGDVSLDDAFINLTSTEGLEYDSFTSPYNWKYDEASKKWTLLDELGVNKSATIILKFKAVKAGNQDINVSCGEGNHVLNNSANSTRIKNPDFVIEQRVDNSNVSSGTVVKFTVNITNTGDCDLTNLKLYESDYSGLIFIKSDDKDKWLKDGDTFKFNGTLAVGESAEIEFYFNTSQIGLFKNSVTVSTDETKNKTSDCYVNVYKVDHPKLVSSVKNNEKEIRKGNKASATITLKNVGDCDLNNIFIDISNLKEFDSFTGDNWIRKGNRLIYNGILKPGEEINLIIKYKPEKTGYFTSTLLSGSNLTETEELKLEVNVIDSSNNTRNNKTDNAEGNDLKSNDSMVEPPHHTINSDVGGKTVGNPIAMLLLTIFSLFVTNINIKK